MHDVVIAVSTAGLPRETGPWAGGPKRAITWAAGLGCRAVQLDATTPGMRARELDRSGRRDLAAALRRAELSLTGFDLWIPPKHFLDPSHQERATDAVIGAIGLASELTTLGASVGAVVSVHFSRDAPADLAATLRAEADRAGVRLADHGFPIAHAASSGLDPAVVLLAGEDPVSVAASSKDLASARLSDAGLAGRVPPGSDEGRLDVDAYLASLTVAGYDRPVILDLRGLGDLQHRTATDVIDRWGA